MFLLLIFLVFLLFCLEAFQWGIGPSPTSPKVGKLCLEMVSSLEVSQIYELGSGSGNMACALAKQFPEAKVRAFEGARLIYLISKLCSLFYPANIQTYRRDFFDESLYQADLIFCYLYPKAMERLSKKFEKELRPGTYVLSHTFSIPNKLPQKVLRAPDLYQTPVYLYQY